MQIIKIIPPWLYPHSQERELIKSLDKFYLKISTAFDSIIIANFDSLTNRLKKDDQVQVTATEEESKKDETLALLIAILLGELWLLDREFIYANAKNVAAFNDFQFKKIVDKALKVVPGLEESTLPETLSAWTSQVEQLATAKATDFIESGAAIIRDGELKGLPVPEIKQALVDSSISFKKKLEGIAIDQIGNLNGGLTRTRQMGINNLNYVWVTQQDERVRHLHVKRHGKVFSWVVTPSDGHPGMPHRCRCVASMVLKYDFTNQFTIDPHKRAKLAQYKPGVRINQRLSRDRDYMAAIRSSLLGPAEIIKLHKDKTLGAGIIDDLLSSGKLSKGKLEELYKIGMQR